MHSTKISGLAVDTEYTFHLVLRTTAGTFASERVVVRTHKMTDLSGITITTGILPPATRESLGHAVERIGAKIVDGVRIDTTHFVTTEGRGLQWEKANEMNIPVVRPEWVEACEKTGRILGVTKFYLDAVRPPAGEETPITSASAASPAPKVQKDLPPPPEGPTGAQAVRLMAARMSPRGRRRPLTMTTTRTRTTARTRQKRKPGRGRGRAEDAGRRERQAESSITTKDNSGG